jgi:non-specific protein-tyrosine kinase
MSRIQNILEKAERDGAIRRMRTVVETASVAAAEPVPFTPPALDLVAQAPAVAPVSPTVAIPAPPAAAVSPPIANAAHDAPSPAPARAVGIVRLHPHLIAANGHVAAEQYRALRTRMFHADNGAAVNVLLITSPGRRDGKSLTAANLGLSIAQEPQRRVCVVDADLRQPLLHRLFGIADGPGLADVLSGDATLEDSLVTIENHHITVLPAGAASAHPAELLGSTTMRRTLDQLRSRFDCVVIDAPAALPLADVGILTPLVDSVVMVVRAGMTPKPSIHDAIGSIDRAKLLGIVLNDAS